MQAMLEVISKDIIKLKLLVRVTPRASIIKLFTAVINALA